MPTVLDDEFGTINVRRIPQSTSIRMSVAPNGNIRLSVPSLMPLFMIKRMIEKSRQQIRKLVDQSSNLILQDGMAVGKQHSLQLRETSEKNIRVVRQKNRIIVHLPYGANALHTATVKNVVRPAMIQALRREAKLYLPERIKRLAELHGYTYTSVRFSHASTRWGSCTSKGVISLNVALMMLPYELIDYVLVHELAHTKQMNHSRAFWSLVQEADPNYKKHRLLIKARSPHV